MVDFDFSSDSTLKVIQSREIDIYNMRNLRLAYDENRALINALYRAKSENLMKD